MDTIKQTPGEKAFEAVNLTLVLLITIVLLYPLLFVIIASVSDPRKIYDTFLLVWPQGFNLESYKAIFENGDIWIGYRNTVLYTTVGTAINVFMTILGAYPLSRRRFYGKNVFTFLFTFTMFFSGGLIPTYLVNQSLGILNSIWVLVLPGAISVFNLIIMRTYFQTQIPVELEESAFVDGCSDWRLLFKIVLPLSMPIIAVMILFYGVGHWNSYFDSLIYMTDRDKFPLQLFLREILIKNSMQDMLGVAVDEQYSQRMMAREGIKYSIVVASSLPLLILYPLLSKFFEKGILVGAIKG
ncbi:MULTISPECIES: carbohydrate ABC transporter permease [unclassified Paenibacillus]|uniref:carbohydrate ABC transporter permease n=1 Tax=unclassified Paenibacillus TaxID=185978 RepID=UPI000956FEC1|nr:MULTISPECIES: carbohydrate ABC transporter permease [unclassified Paenibacillus]ASS66056.1 carbohydrate ABC transporter permease [Paenibacillus sp. RUD330]SIQ14001.1 putative aldouronate transport system permease protein [Paenibacillus sp. RU4X]SIQ35839.1 putative aldouronate transport system permease protein [Paenibacillus sp. RU4T]